MNISVQRIENAAMTNPAESAQVVGDVGWSCAFDAPAVLVDFGDFSVMLTRPTALDLVRGLSEASRDG